MSIFELTGTNGATLLVEESGDDRLVVSGLEGFVKVDAALDPQGVALLATHLLGWLQYQPAYAGLGLEIASKHLDAKVRQHRPAS